MDQRTIVAYLALRGLWGRSIHNDLRDTLGPDAMASRPVTRSLREACCLPSDEEPPSVEDDRGVHEGNQVILFALNENSRMSMRELS
jgi:hypothetical protein